MDEDEKKRIVDKAIEEFRFRATPLVLTGNQKALKKRFVRTTALARLRGDSTDAAIRIHSALREAILAPSENVRRGMFKDP